MRPSQALPLLTALKSASPEGVRTRAIDRLAYARDASHILLTPRAVVVAQDAAEVAALLRVAAEHQVSLTFRSGGTSLSGQAGTSDVLVDTRRGFRDVEVLDAGLRVRAQPGVTLRQVNARLAPYGRRLGPDPASDIACTVGGVVANNSSGMTCGTEYNSYRTLDSVEVILPSGTIVDTAVAGADDRLRALEPGIHAGLAELRDLVRGDEIASQEIRRQFSMKNTMGYGINSLLDFDSPVEILAHLVVGSEGTLGFISRATLRTVPVPEFATTGLLVFPSLSGAVTALDSLIDCGATAIELMDAAALRVALLDPTVDPALRGLVVGEHAALLVEWQEFDADDLRARSAEAGHVLSDLDLALPAKLTVDPALRSNLWRIRKGLYASVAGARPPGTTALLEDIAVPVSAIVETCSELVRLFDRHGYDDAVIFGHARDGNLHFMLTERFADDGPPGRYALFTEDLVDLVLGQGGTLKAEHGTGRAMSPFVRRQYGDDLYAVMRQIKQLFDPRGILSPGVLISDQADAHLRDLKTSPRIEPEVDRCVDCGYCEPVCPSRNLTMTPRQRIAVRREQASAKAHGDHGLARELARDSLYPIIETCAADGMCGTVCPLGIDTGAHVKALRIPRHRALTRAAWRVAATRWDIAIRGVGLALDAASTMPAVLPMGITRALRGLNGRDTIPAWAPDFPRGGSARRPARAARNPAAIYLPSCTASMFAPASSTGGVSESVMRLASRAGVELIVPGAIGRLCCGAPWSSKGLPEGAAVMRRLVAEAVAAAGAADDVPIVSDAASCSEGYRHLLAERRAGARVTDSVSFAADSLLPRLTIQRRFSAVALHPTCSSTQLGINASLMTIARAVAERAVVPDGWGCCGMAGDRGLLHPELPAAATEDEVRSVAAGDFDAWASLNRPCEIAMTRATGRPYRHILELLDEATAPPERVS